MHERSIETFATSLERKAAAEQDKRLGPLSDEMPLMDTGLDSLCFAKRAGWKPCSVAGRAFSENERERSCSP